jgi:thiamine pyrophosphate-dependent acetolactate synthase large subunit-like protein
MEASVHQVDEIPVRSLFADVLVEAGIDRVFGMPGGHRPWVVEVVVDDLPHFRLMPQ